MKHDLKISIVLFMLLPALGWASDPFDELDSEIAQFESEKRESAEQLDEFQRYMQSQKSDYQIWQIEYLNAFDEFEQEVVEKWGKVESIQAEYEVEFSEDKNVKTVIDYHKEQLKIELIFDKNLSHVEAEKALQQQINELLADKESNVAKVFSGADSLPISDVAISDIEFSDAHKQQGKENIIKQAQMQAQEIDKQADRAMLPESLLTTQEAHLLATQAKTELLKSSQVRLNNSETNYQEAQNNNKNNTKIIAYTVSLPKNSLQERASKYVVFAEKESKVNQIPAPLIMAIMHSESAFNPKAKSAVPAYGLMQIVPRTAGHDVNKLVRNIDKPMNADELYIPKVNIETGSAYLNILDKRYLKGITNDQSRLYCTIAAYNTGAGNVARVFNHDGSRNINKATKIINQLPAEEVYQQLLAKLPFDETKHYLQRVSSRIALYQTQ